MLPFSWTRSEKAQGKTRWTSTSVTSGFWSRREFWWQWLSHRRSLWGVWWWFNRFRWRWWG